MITVITNTRTDMKLRHLFLLLATAGLFAVSCGDKEDTTPEEPDVPDTVKAALSLLASDAPVLSDEGGTFTVSFKSTLDWQAKAAATWVTIEPASGAAGERCTVTVTVLENRTYDERSSTVTLSCGDGDNKASVEIPFTQKQKGALILAESTIPVADDGGIVSITVKTTSDLTVKVEGDAAAWITPLGTKGLVETELQFEVKPNEGYDPREGVISFSNDTHTDKVTVVQSAKGAIIIETTSYSVAAEGADIRVSVKATSTVTAKVEGEAAAWITQTDTKGLEENVFSFNIQPNESYDAREGKISFSCEAGVKQVTVTQKEKSALIVETTSYSVSFEGGQISIPVKATSDVTATVEGAAAEWITAVGTRALAESAFIFDVAANESYDPREGVITFSSEAGRQQVTVSQVGKGDILIETTEYPVSYEGGEISVKVQATGTVTAAVEDAAAEWILPVETRGLQESEFLFEVLANELEQPREGVITFSCEDKSKQVTVIQEGFSVKPVIIDIATPDEFIAFASQYNAGEYIGVADLQVNLLGDLAFDEDSSSAFNATGGVGTLGDGENTNYFGGKFDGGNHTVSGLKATAPLFAYVGSEGSIKDLVIDASCAFVCTHPGGETNAYFAPVAGYHKGSIENVQVHADVTLSASSAEITGYTILGGIVGRATTGTVANCSYDGQIATPDGYTTSGKLLIGGLVGYFSNTGSLTASTFAGTISNEARTICTGKDPYLVIGGLVGYNAHGTISQCQVNNTPDAEQVAGAYANSFGTIVNKTVQSFCMAVGGAVGINYGEISGVTNYAKVLNTVFKEDNSNDNGRYLRVGGIAGMNRKEGKIVGCTNEAEMIIRSNPRLHSFGGIVGWNEAESFVEDCTNRGALSISTAGVGSYSARLPYFGGVIGENYSSGISNLYNYGNLQISRIENTTGSDVRMGGILGANFAPVSGGQSITIVNFGQVYYNCNISSQAIKYCVGGVAGFTTESISGAANYGYVLFNWNSDANVASQVHLGGVVGLFSGTGSIEHCANLVDPAIEHSGEVNLALKKGAAGHTENKVGGILGGVSDYVVDTETTIAAAVKIANCDNYGYIHGGNTNKVNGKTLYLGGIAGHLVGASSISDCANDGVLLNDQFNNTNTKVGSTFEGGIAGFVEGTADTPIAISNVTNKVTGAGPRRGYCGGIVGYAEYAQISGAVSEGDYAGGSAYHIGGLVGWAVNTSITRGSYKGASITTTQIQTAGGIVALLDAGSVVDGCSSALSSVTPGANECVYGAIAGKSVEGSTITGSHYSSSLPICSDANFTDGGGNAADL